MNKNFEKNICIQNKKYLPYDRYFFAEININYFLDVFLRELVFAELDFADDLVEDFLQEQAELEFEQLQLP